MLDNIYLDNTLRTWLIALAIVVVLTSLLLLIKGLVHRKLKKFAQGTATDIDDLIADLLGRTRIYFFAAVSLFAASQVLYKTAEVQDLLRIFIVLTFLIQSGIWGNGLIAYGIKRTTKKGSGEGAPNQTTMSVLGFVGRLLLWTVVLLLVLDNLNIDVTTLIAGLGIGGIAVALALQNILGDLFASLSIMLDKPFVIGDFIVVDTMSGTVEHVGLKTTRIRSLSGEQIIISNEDLLKSRIRNYKRMQERRILFSVGVEYSTPAEKLERIPGMLREIVESQAQVRFDRAHLQMFGDSAILFEIVYFLLDPNYTAYMNTQQNINLAIVRRFGEEGIHFAFPSRTVYVKQKVDPA
jgi:small-conductance mechanosensitive channel